MSDIVDQVVPGSLNLVLKPGGAQSRMSAIEPTLQRINERFGRYLRASLLQHLRRSVAVTAVGVEFVEHRALIERLPNPTHFTLFNMRPLRGTVALMVDAVLVAVIVESRFGGNGRFPINTANRDFTPFELKSMRRVADVALEQVAKAWEPLGRFEPEILRYETNPQFAGFAAADDLILVNSFDVVVDQGRGRFDVLVPCAAVEALHAQASSGAAAEAADRDLRWSENLQASVAQAAITLNVELGKIEISVGDLIALRPGIIFEMHRPERLVVEASGVPLFRGRWGRHGGKIGVLVEECLSSAAGAHALQIADIGEDG